MIVCTTSHGASLRIFWMVSKVIQRGVSFSLFGRDVVRNVDCSNWFFDSTHFIWIFLSKFIYSVKQPIRRNSMGARYVSHCRDSAFDDYFYHSFIVFEDVFSEICAFKGT